MGLQNLVGISLEQIAPARETIKRLLDAAARHIADAKVNAISAEIRRRRMRVPGLVASRGDPQMAEGEQERLVMTGIVAAAADAEWGRLGGHRTNSGLNEAGYAVIADLVDGAELGDRFFS